MSYLQEIQYTVGTDVAINMQGLADGAKALSDAIDNSVTRYAEADIGFRFKTNQHKIDTTNGVVVIGILRSCDGGVTYDNYLRPGNILAVINDLDADTEYVLSVSTNQLGYLPAYFKISVRNGTGAPFFHKEDKFGVWFTGKRILSVASNASMAYSMSGDWLRS
jgi:hypothetical protein